jgi:hypothetical protein
MTRHPDEGEIRAWLVAFRQGQEGRDRLVRMANEAGIPIREISQLSGISRTTIYKILGLEGEQ